MAIGNRSNQSERLRLPAKSKKEDQKMSFIEERNQKAQETLRKAFQKRNMEMHYCSTAAQAKETILSLIPEGSSVTWGGTESMKEAGVLDALYQKNYTIINRADAKTSEESRALYGKMVCCDYFLTSTNAFTVNGELVNVDGASNRVACIAHGPQHVIVLASMDKLCASVPDAYDRIRTLASPPNALRVGANTPCAKTGVCGNCLSPDCICCQILVTRYSRVPGRIQIVLCGEKLGF